MPNPAVKSALALIADWCTDWLTAHGYTSDGQYPSVKTSEAVKAANLMTRYQSDLQAIGASGDDEARMRDRIIALLLIYALWAYAEGITDSGADPLEVAGAQDQIQQAAQTWATQQTTYAAGLAQAMAQNAQVQATPIGAPLPTTAASSSLTNFATQAPTVGGGTIPLMTVAVKQASAEAIVERAGQWAETLKAFKLDGYVKGAELGGDDPYVEWVYGETEHCDTCNELNGRKELLSWFLLNGYVPRQPASETLDCRGYNCKCKLIRVSDGKQIM